MEKPKIRLRVTLEPELEQMAILWTPIKRLDMARAMERWARQLRVSARIMLRDARPVTSRPRLQRLSDRRLRRN